MFSLTTLSSLTSIVAHSSAMWLTTSRSFLESPVPSEAVRPIIWGRWWPSGMFPMFLRVWYSRIMSANYQIFFRNFRKKNSTKNFQRFEKKCYCQFFQNIFLKKFFLIFNNIRDFLQDKIFFLKMWKFKKKKGFMGRFADISFFSIQFSTKNFLNTHLHTACFWVYCGIRQKWLSWRLRGRIVLYGIPRTRRDALRRDFWNSDKDLVIIR